MRRLFRAFRAFDLTPLGHPVWWGALALLLINDNLFKGHGVVPGWLAGKLSDFAFLIVAPTLFATLIPRRVPGRRTFATAAVVAVYVAADLSRGASDAVIAVAARVGLHWRLWPDPTDLLALAVLPITVWLLRRTPRPDADSATARRARVQRERAGVVLGAIACLATSSLPGYPHNAFLFNRTAANADVRITWVLRKIPCTTSPDALGPALIPSDLDDPITVTLMSGEVAALDGVPAAGTVPRGVCSTRPQMNYNIYSEGQNCVAAILESTGAAPVLMVAPKIWEVSDSGGFISCCDNSPSPESNCRPMLPIGPSPGGDAVSLSNRDGTLRFALTHTGPREEGPVLSTHIQLGPIDPAAIAARPPAPNGCRETRDMYHALLGSAAAACTTDADCQVLPGLELPGEDAECALFVNRTVSAETVQVVESQWQSACTNAVDSQCRVLPATCRSGRCVELCSNTSVPYCPYGCQYKSDYPNGSCADTDTCFNAAKENCTCVDSKWVCAMLPPAGPNCPVGCLSDDLYTAPGFDGGIDTGAGGGGDAGAPADAGGAADALAPDSARDAGATDGGDAG
ncbi:MAG TPA: hypothetical protein VN903_07325 [Polyangia bacterium]|jgi:hypothetical protein|nr:hypothetical protein [Polyangia bacterium]